MASPDSAPSLSGITLIGLGAVGTAFGGLGVGFRAAGLGYLGQSVTALVVGVAMLSIGLRIAARARRSEFASARTASARVHPAYAVATTVAPPVQRVRVTAWTTPVLELPPARAA